MRLIYEDVYKNCDIHEGEILSEQAIKVEKKPYAV